MEDSLDWLPPDEPQQAACGWTDAKSWALVAGVGVMIIGGRELTAQASATRVLGVFLLLAAASFSLRVVLTRVSVGADGLDVRGVIFSRRIGWGDVAAIETTSGPIWLAIVSSRAWRAKDRLTQRRTTATVIHLREGRVLRPLALIRSYPSRRADNVTRLAQQLRAADSA